MASDCKQCANPRLKGIHTCGKDGTPFESPRDIFDELQEGLDAMKARRWHEFYLRMAKEFATMARDPRLHVGAVIVTPEGILYPGYNGWEKGGTNEPDSLEPGQSGTVHAEANAILKFNPTIHKGSTMYLTHNPCIVCARMIVNTQAISRVYYDEEYRDLRGINILKARGIHCERIKVSV